MSPVALGVQHCALPSSICQLPSAHPLLSLQRCSTPSLQSASWVFEPVLDAPGPFQAVLVLAVVIFFILVSMGLWFGFALETVLTTQGCFCYCWAVLTESRSLFFSNTLPDSCRGCEKCEPYSVSCSSLCYFTYIEGKLMLVWHFLNLPNRVPTAFCISKGNV